MVECEGLEREGAPVRGRHAPVVCPVPVVGPPAKTRHSQEIEKVAAGIVGRDYLGTAEAKTDRHNQGLEIRELALKSTIGGE